MALVNDFVAKDFNLSPQGDGNLGFQAQRQHATGISTYPRKGAKKLRIKNGAEFFFCVP